MDEYNFDEDESGPVIQERRRNPETGQYEWVDAPRKRWRKMGEDTIRKPAPRAGKPLLPPKKAAKAPKKAAKVPKKAIKQVEKQRKIYHGEAPGSDEDRETYEDRRI